MHTYIHTYIHTYMNTYVHIGRVNCESVTFTIDLKPRHDLFMYLYGNPKP
jgi:hypothetical protein